MIEAYHDMLDLGRGVDDRHDTIPARVQAIVAMIGDGDWTLPPVLVVESCGNGASVLDGHHRIAAACALGIDEIPAIVVPRDDYEMLIEDEFGGDEPDRLGDLDDYIMIDGAAYSLRDNHHDAA